MDVRDHIKKSVLLFDGAMGTYFAGGNGGALCDCEEASVISPDKIYKIHREYIAAGADALKTDSFSCGELYRKDREKAERIISASYALACRAVADSGRDVAVFADIGPVYSDSGSSLSPEDVYIGCAEKFIEAGAENFIFETLPSLYGIKGACEYIKKLLPHAFILVSFAVSPDGFTRSGHSGEALCRNAAGIKEVDAIGFNCLSGPSHLIKLASGLYPLGKPVSVMPNAGYPTEIGSRTFFEGDPAYFASSVAGATKDGARIVGGCCGTTPESIRALRSALGPDMPEVSSGITVKTVEKKPKPAPVWEKKRCIAVELDPPDTAEIGGFMSGAAAICEAGADAITIADCPISRARADSSILAAKLHRELGITAIPHMTCRDRNINATKALLLGLGIEGVDHVLVVTGDPVPTSDRSTVKSVYNFNSQNLAAFIRDLGETEGGAYFSVAGALNVNAVNFDAQLRHAEKKVECGMTALFTQPVMTERALENLSRAYSELDCRIMCGIMPVVSHRNALFMDAEIPGMSIDKKTVDMYEGLDREGAEALSERLCTEIAEKAASCCHGYYIMTPFRRIGLVSRIVRNIKKI